MKKLLFTLVFIIFAAACPVSMDMPFGTAVFCAELPEVGAQGAILMDFKTGRVLWEKNADEPLAMASTTKIMTALLALEKGDQDDEVIVSQEAAQTPPVKMFLQKGEKIKLEYLLYALMLQSSNDAAVAIAEHIGGTVENFCGMMTERAKSLGCDDTVFETPNGLDQGEHHSTARDMANIARAALNNKDFLRIINTPSVTFKSSRTTYDVNNKNRLLNEFEGANGIKTGYTGKAGQCFVGAAKRGDMQLISVVLASGWGNKGKEQKWTDTKRILSYGFNNYEYESILTEQSVAEQVKIERSKTEKLDAKYSESIVVPLAKDESVNVEVDVPSVLCAPIEKNETIGSAKVFVDGELYKEVAIVSSGEALRHDLKTSLEKVLSEFVQMGTVSEAEVTLPEF